MRPGGLRRSSALALAGLVGSSLVTVLGSAAPARASVAVDEVYGRPASGVFQVLGHGWGHGRGMSQYGAYGAATIGRTADEITATYYPGTTRAVQGNPLMRVLLSTDSRATTREFVPQSGQVMKDLATGSAVSLPTSALRWRVTSDSSGLHAAYVDSTGATRAVAGTFAGPLQVSGGAYVRVRLSTGAGRDYRGAVRVLRSGSSLLSLAVMPMESYLYGVVPRESSSSWPGAALQAQAIAARSYSEYKREHVSTSQVYDICDTTQCQVFGGSASYGDANDPSTRRSLEATSTNDAVNATQGVVRTYGGRAVFAEFSASNGGWSTDGGVPYLVAKADPWDGITGSSVHSWTASLPVTALECRYGPQAPDGSCARRSDGSPEWRLTRVTITQRDGNGEWGGRVEAGRIDFVDSSGAPQSVDVSGSGFYSARSWPAYSDGLRSRWFHIVPEYDAQLVSRSAAPLLVQPPGASTGQLTAVVTNTGSGSWPVAGLHLAVASPAGAADPLAGGSTRPGTYVGNLTHPDASSVVQGDQVQFSVPLDARGVAPGTRTEAYRLRIGTAALFGPTIAWSVTVQSPRFTGAAASAPALVSSDYTPAPGAPPVLSADGRTVVVPRTGTTTLRLTTRNTGNLTWPVAAGTPLLLGTSGPRDAAGSSYGSDWVSSSRVSPLAGTADVGPGAAGTFELPLHGNGRPAGVTLESFEPVWNGQGWISGAPTALTVVRVDPAVSRLAAVELAPRTGFSLLNAPNGRADLVVRLRNVGADPWAVGQEQLRAPSRVALAYRWPAADRTPPLRRNVSRPGTSAVYPGEVGEWVVPLSAFKVTPATYALALRPATPGGAAYGPTLTSRITVRKAVFSYALTSVQRRADVPRRGTAVTTFLVKNTGNVDWPVGGSLRSTVPGGRSPSRAPSWYTASRPGSLSQNASSPRLMVVRPGQVARFRVVLAGNGRAPGSHRETFGMAWDGWQGTSVRAVLAYRVV